MQDKAKSSWESGEAYERYVGRWSRKVAIEFLRRLAQPHGLIWADIGCGTGALLSAILAMCEPAQVYGIDASDNFIAQARLRISDPRASFRVADATRLPLDAGACDATVSSLMLNFVSDHEAAVREMVRVTRPGGVVASYVWDYAGGMQMMRLFWEAAGEVTPEDAKLDEGQRFPICQPEPLAALFTSAGLKTVSVDAIDIPTVFENFDDYWAPFLGKTGAAPTYLASVSDAVQEQIQMRLRSRLAMPDDGPITLTARAWAVQGIV